MGQESKIEWTHHTFNPWIGCSKVSPGCKNCYAEADMDNRRKRVQWGVNGTRSVTSYSYWREALSWNRAAEAAGERRRVFCASLADVFEEFEGQVIDSKQQDLWWNEEWCQSSLGLAHICGNDYAGEKYCDVDGIPPLNYYNEDYMYKQNIDIFKSSWEKLTINIIRQYLFRLIEMTPNLDWLLLTKRPENVMKMVPEHWKRRFPNNVWMGTSVENQEQANIRIPMLGLIPSKVTFLSMEPLLEQVDLRNLVNQCKTVGHDEIKMSWLDWVIVGGESGKGKRPFDPEWARKLRDTCFIWGIRFFMKQIDKVQPVPEDLMIREFP